MNEVSVKIRRDQRASWLTLLSPRLQGENSLLQARKGTSSDTGPTGSFILDVLASKVSEIIFVIANHGNLL